MSEYNGLLAADFLQNLPRIESYSTVGYAARTETDKAVWGYNLDFAWNTGSGSNNDLLSYQSEYAFIDTVHWKALRGGFNYHCMY